MKKKTYGYNIAYKIIFFLTILLFISGVIFEIVELPTLTEEDLDSSKILELALILIVGPILIALMIVVSLYKITLTNEYIFAPTEVGTKMDIVQYETKVYFKDIVDLRIIMSTKNSRKKSFNIRVRLRRFLEFVLQNGRTKWIDMSKFTKKQTVQIFKDIEARMVACGNEVILQDPNEMIKNLGEDGNVFVATMTNMIDNKIKQRKEKRALKKAEKRKSKNSKR